ncbi:MAG: gliding motility-associated C-terminal domain-containing protein [Flavobacteriales bacterium]
MFSDSPIFILLKALDLTVYNRWGNKVFYSTDVNLKWDGKNNKGEKLSDGTYYYSLNTTTQENKVIIKHNFLTIFN